MNKYQPSKILITPIQHLPDVVGHLGPLLLKENFQNQFRDLDMDKNHTNLKHWGVITNPLVYALTSMAFWLNHLWI